MKYRKKPIVIEAIKLEKTNIRQAYLFCHPNEPQAFNGTRQEYERWDDYERLVMNQGGLKIETNEGIMLAYFGDYIIKEPFPTNDRMFYPCKPDIFEKTYEEVVE